MALHTSDSQTFQSPFPSLELDQNMDFLNNLTHFNPTLLDTSNFQSLMGFSIDSYLNQQVLEFPSDLAYNFPTTFDHDEKNAIMDSASTGNDFQRTNRVAIHELDSISAVSSPRSSSDKTHCTGRGKKLKSIDHKEEGKPKGVVHVRARRGQATDSHSLAERVRRGKINERLKCLQDIVPGCHKTMGMAVMLDEIINYVQSLHNQVDFLSMKLAAASTYHNFNYDTNTMETLQRANACEAQQMQIPLSKGNQELSSTLLGPLDLTFGSYPSN